MEGRVNFNLESQLDNNKYDESQLICVKISAEWLSPYYINSKNYERVDGQIEIKGIQYNYVKRRIYQDSVELLCIPNFAVMKLKDVKNNLITWSNDLQQTTSSQKNNSHPAATKNFSLESFTINDFINFSSPYFINVKRWYNFSIPPCFNFPTVIDNPPEQC